MKKILFALLALSTAQAFGSDCKILLTLSGPMESYEREVLDILDSKNYDARMFEWTSESWRDTTPTSSISLNSAGDMQFKKWQRIHMVTTKGSVLTDHSIEVGLFSNKETAVLRFLNRAIKVCK